MMVTMMVMAMIYDGDEGDFEYGMTTVVRLAEVIASGIVGLAFALTTGLIIMVRMMMMMMKLFFGMVKLFFWGLSSCSFGCQTVCWGGQAVCRGCQTAFLGWSSCFFGMVKFFWGGQAAVSQFLSFSVYVTEDQVMK